MRNFRKSCVVLSNLWGRSLKYLVEDQLTLAQLDPLPLQAQSGGGENTNGTEGHHDVSIQ